jgi:hypothetical protein
MKYLALSQRLNPLMKNGQRTEFTESYVNYLLIHSVGDTDSKFRQGHGKERCGTAIQLSLLNLFKKFLINFFSKIPKMTK